MSTAEAWIRLKIAGNPDMPDVFSPNAGANEREFVRRMEQLYWSEVAPLVGDVDANPLAEYDATQAMDGEK